MLNFLLNWIFPLRCVGNCGTWNVALCDTCLARAIEPGYRCITNEHTGDFDLYYLGVYQKPILQAAVHNLKYVGIQVLGEMLGTQLSTIVDIHNYDYIVPVPLHTKRQRERGFNQSWLLANAMSGSKATNLLTRQRYTTAQATLNREGRLKNLHDAFVLSKQFHNHILGSRILLVDDVYTTGSTIQTCRTVLLEAGATTVDAVVIAID